MASMTMKCGKYSLEFGERTLVMAIVNVTPDSFSDGGQFLDSEKAIAQGLRLAEEGADIIDIGGESTRPGSESVALNEELRRVIPVIEGLVGKIEIPISIDTCKSEVAKKAIDAGACMINDISAARFDSKLMDVAREYEVPLALMHMKGTPKNMQENPTYDSVMGEIKEFLNERVGFAVTKGIPRENILIDPGIGFGKGR
ncbi:MAG: dihydropteroate synthase [Thermoplasmata archaeon]|nr:MAG: dihydropteroate synthase [Thermoplasmata archaeon]